MENACPVALVTGSSRGLGRGIAVELARRGFSVAVNYAGNRAAAEESARLCAVASGECAGRGGSVRSIFRIFQADIGERAERERLVREVFDAYGRLDALVNNAGMAPRVRADILDAGEESFEELLRVNLQGPYFLTQAVVRRWVEGRGAPHGPGDGSLLPGGYKVVFVTSISAETASTGRGEYCVSKAGLAMAAKLWAVRTAGLGVQVYEIRPGIMETDMTAGVRDRYDKLIADGLVPQGRWGSPEDVGRAAAALLGGDFAFSTGAVVYSDGGFNLSRL